jgi:hypothetical protein
MNLDEAVVHSGYIRARHVPMRPASFPNVQSIESRDVSLDLTGSPMKLLMEGLEKSGKRKEKSGNSFPLMEISKDGREGV